MSQGQSDFQPQAQALAQAQADILGLEVLSAIRRCYETSILNN